jgi:hypothetical protein
MAQPVLDAPRVVAGIRQGVAAGMAEHVGVDRKGEAGAIADALDQSVDGVGRERAAERGPLIAKRQASRAQAGLPSSLVLAPVLDIPSDLQACQQIRIAGQSATSRFPDAFSPAVWRKSRPLLDQAVSNSKVLIDALGK